METTRKIEMVEVGKIIPYAGNARTHSSEQIKKLRASLREFGFVNPLLIDKDYGLIAGHGRLMAAEAEGLTMVPCVFVEHLSEAQKRAYILADNRLAEMAGWDEEILRIELEKLKELNFDISLTGFEEFKYTEPPTEDNFDVGAELDKPAVAKLGDVVTLGRHRIICGDSTKPETYEKLLNGEKVNLVLSDPPYMVDLENGSGKILNDNLNDERGEEFLDAAFSEFAKAMATDASIYIFYASTKGKIFYNAFEKYFKLMAGLVWVKDIAVLSRGDWNFRHEPVLYGKLIKGTHKWYGDFAQSTVLEFDRIKNSATEGWNHPSSKPIPLISRLIQLSSKQGDKILDGFLGSGSTLIAAEQLGRTAFGVELEPKFIDVVVERFKTVSGEKITVERGGEKFSFDDLRG